MILLGRIFRRGQRFLGLIVLIGLASVAFDQAVAIWPSSQPIPPSFEFPVYLTLLDETTVVVSWRTRSARTGMVSYGTTPFLGQTANSATSQQQHFVTLSSLLPGTTYHYRVNVDGTSDFMDGTFTTAGGNTVRFAHFGEFHAPWSSSDENSAIFTDVIRAFEPHLIVESGDMWDTGHSLNDLRFYMTHSRPWLPNALFLPCYSNHVTWTDYIPNNMVVQHFMLPDDHGAGRRPYYSTRYGLVQVITLQSSEMLGEQRLWLEDKVREAHDGINDPLFLVLAWHYPAYVYGGGDQGVITHFINTIEANGGADLILVAHERMAEVSRKDYPNGHVMWHVQSCMGLCYRYVRPGNPLSVFTTRRAILLGEVTGGTLSGKMVDNAGTILYQFEIQKTPSTTTTATTTTTTTTDPTATTTTTTTVSTTTTTSTTTSTTTTTTTTTTSSSTTTFSTTTTTTTTTLPGGGVTCAGLPATIVGTAGNDVITGTSGPDVIAGLGGNDRINGQGGDDVICGGPGDDRLDGYDGDDAIYGEDGKDYLRGGNGNDTLDGGAGNDKLRGAAGDDALDGGSDTDICSGGNGTDTAVNCETTRLIP